MEFLNHRALVAEFAPGWTLAADLGESGGGADCEVSRCLPGVPVEFRRIWIDPSGRVEWDTTDDDRGNTVTHDGIICRVDGW